MIGGGVTFRVEGVPEVSDAMKAVASALQDALRGAVYREAVEIMNASQRECPIDTGTLRSSGQVQPPATQGDTTTVEVGYGYGDARNPKTGQPATGYAIYVHERLDVRHNPPTKAHFLSDPAKAAEAGFADRIGAQVQPVIR